jgi:hypothetical protein
MTGRGLEVVPLDERMAELTSLNSRAAVVLDEPRTEVEVLDPENGLMLTAVPPAKHSQSPQWCEM